MAEINFRPLLCILSYFLCISLSVSERKEKRTINVYFILFQMPGRKDLVIDGELMKPLDRIASVSLLKVKYEIHLTCTMCNLSSST